jgi:hypothetical protein
MSDPTYYGPMRCCGEVHGGWESPCPTLAALREAVSQAGSEACELPTWGVRILGIDEWARVFAAAFPTPDHLVAHQTRAAYARGAARGKPPLGPSPHPEGAR